MRIRITEIMTRNPMPIEMLSSTSVNKLKKAFDSASVELMDIPVEVDVVFVADIFGYAEKSDSSLQGYQGSCEVRLRKGKGRYVSASRKMRDYMQRFFSKKKKKN